MSSIFTLEKLYLAYNECKKGKKNTHNALAFEMEREKNLLKLLENLQTREYKISRYIYFIAIIPTAREIFAADFRDRIVHHLVYKELYDIFDTYFIDDSYANRVNKGTHRAVNKLRENMNKTKLWNSKQWYLKLDIQSFFRSIDKNILYSLLERKIKCSSFQKENSIEWESDILWITKTIIFNNPTKNFIYRGKTILKNLIPKSKSLFYSGGLGLPIGNLTSQFFANIYLNEFDQFVTKALRINNYIRYVDDFIIINNSKEKLKSIISIIDNFLQINLGLRIHPRKIILQETRRGVDFLGYYIRPTHTLVRQKVVKRFKDRLHKKRNHNDGFFSLSDIPMIKSYLGHFGHANSYRLIKKLSK